MIINVVVMYQCDDTYISLCSFVFFVKQKTAYEMRISDWSSDVCSSDLRRIKRTGRARHKAPEPRGRPHPSRLSGFARLLDHWRRPADRQTQRWQADQRRN